MWTIPIPSPRAGRAPIDVRIVYFMPMATSGIAQRSGAARRAPRPPAPNLIGRRRAADGPSLISRMARAARHRS
ncbi:MAG: hypothetical protein NFCOHLIN_03119 [Gammaproteobacteria bacterium]|nr:hypothetical protein [Gammaproteobacteria bacterium]